MTGNIIESIKNNYAKLNKNQSIFFKKYSIIICIDSIKKMIGNINDFHNFKQRSITTLIIEKG